MSSATSGRKLMRSKSQDNIHINSDNNNWNDKIHRTCRRTSSGSSLMIRLNDSPHHAPDDTPGTTSKLRSSSKAKTIMMEVRKKLVRRRKQSPDSRFSITKQPPPRSQAHVFKADAKDDSDNNAGNDSGLHQEFEGANGAGAMSMLSPFWNNSTCSTRTFQSIASSTTTTTTVTSTSMTTPPTTPKVPKETRCGGFPKMPSGGSRSTATTTSTTMTSPTRTPRTKKKTRKIQSILLSSNEHESLPTAAPRVSATTKAGDDNCSLPRLPHGIWEEDVHGREAPQQVDDSKQNEKTAISTTSILKTKATKKKSKTNKHSLKDSVDSSRKKDGEQEVGKIDYNDETILNTNACPESPELSPYRGGTVAGTKLQTSNNENKVHVKKARTTTSTKLKKKANLSKERREKDDREQDKETNKHSNKRPVSQSRTTTISKTTKKSSRSNDAGDFVAPRSIATSKKRFDVTTAATTSATPAPGLPMFIEFEVKSNEDDACSAITTPLHIPLNSDDKNKEEGFSLSISSLLTLSSHSASIDKSNGNKISNNSALLGTNHDMKYQIYGRRTKIPLEPEGTYHSTKERIITMNAQNSLPRDLEPQQQQQLVPVASFNEQFSQTSPQPPLQIEEMTAYASLAMDSNESLVVDQDSIGATTTTGTAEAVDHWTPAIAAAKERIRQQNFQRQEKVQQQQQQQQLEQSQILVTAAEDEGDACETTNNNNSLNSHYDTTPTSDPLHAIGYAYQKHCYC